ncbi:hypothetical protein LINPERHAP2_LOCUS15934 [Linum perenne]
MRSPKVSLSHSPLSTPSQVILFAPSQTLTSRYRLTRPAKKGQCGRSMTTMMTFNNGSSGLEEWKGTLVREL